MRNLIWTDHAIERVSERIGFDPDIPIPKEQLLKTASLLPDGAGFRQTIGPVIYICKRKGRSVIVLTVVRVERETRKSGRRQSSSPSSVDR